MTRSRAVAFVSYVLYYFAEVHSFRKCVFCRIFKIFCNVYLFSSSCISPVGCISFVRWKKNQNQYYVLFRNVDNLMHSKSTHDEIHLTSKSVFNCFEQICTMKTMWGIKSTYRFWISSKMVPNFASLIFIQIWKKVPYEGRELQKLHQTGFF